MGIAEYQYFSVKFWKVERKENTEADMLARIALDEFGVLTITGLNNGDGKSTKGDSEDGSDFQRRASRWQHWLADLWYGGIISYLIF